MAWPLIVGMLSFTAMSLADTLFVGRLGMAELAGVGLAATVFYLVNSFFMMTLRGAGIVVSQSDGAGDRARGQAAAWQAVWLGLPFGALVAGAGFFAEDVLGVIGGTPEVLEAAAAYFAVRVLAAPLWYIAVPLHAYFNGIGDTRVVMKLTLVANILNIVLDPMFIFGFGPIPALGVAGAAWATVISFGVAMVATVVVFLARFGWAPVWRPDLLREVVRLGSPMGVRAVMGVLGWTIVTGLISRMGASELAAHQIAIRIVSVSFLPGYGIGEAASILVGRYLGAGRPSHARLAYRNAVQLAVGVMGGLGIVFIAVPEVLMVAFHPSNEVLRIGVHLLQIAAGFQLADAVAMVATGALNGASDTRFTSIASIAGTWLVQLPMAYLFAIPLGLGIDGIWVGLTFEVFAIATVLGIRAHRLLDGDSIPAGVTRLAGAAVAAE